MKDIQMQTVRGTKDILPDKQLLKQWMEARFADNAALFGYGRIETPIFEYASIFNKSLGDESDIIQKEMYYLGDKENDQAIALRPENTAGIVRSYLENGLYSKSLPVRLFYIGPMFRHERPQKAV